MLASFIFYFFYQCFLCPVECDVAEVMLASLVFFGAFFIFYFFLFFYFIFLLCPGEYDAAEDILASLIFSFSPGSARRGADTGIQNSEKSHLCPPFMSHIVTFF